MSKEASTELQSAAGPFVLFQEWFAAATSSQHEANAMALATSTPDGMPSVRMVLLKGIDERGFVFYTNEESRKGAELGANPQAALCFHWYNPEHRQVRVEGSITRASNEEADAYFDSRPRDSRIGAWASLQSRRLDSRQILEARVVEMSERFGDGPIPRPPFWPGFRVVPRRIEFWQERPFRLHDRILFTRNGSGWETERLYP